LAIQSFANFFGGLLIAKGYVVIVRISFPLVFLLEKFEQGSSIRAKCIHQCIIRNLVFRFTGLSDRAVQHFNRVREMFPK
jgi:hypothetical protein